MKIIFSLFPIEIKDVLHLKSSAETWHSIDVSVQTLLKPDFSNAWRHPKLLNVLFAIYTYEIGGMGTKKTEKAQHYANYARYLHLQSSQSLLCIFSN